ncbi:MAG TPA: hypothetical protein VIG86_05605 [Candidatus Dormibacteraeota bacterium]|jgi:hypothetical protein
MARDAVVASARWARWRLNPYRQIDRLVVRQRGAGTAATAPFWLPHARYTVFNDYDPAEAVESFAIVDQRGRRWPDWAAIPAPVAVVTAPLVQEELPAGLYHVEVGTATPTCAWDVQLVLNSMLALRRAPRAWRSLSEVPEVITIRSSDAPVLRVAQTGRYDAVWTVGEAALRPAIHPYSLALRAADGHVVQMGAASASGGRRVNPFFLGAGEWTVEMITSEPWELVISPVVGPTGGGARGF